MTPDTSWWINVILIALAVIVIVAQAWDYSLSRRIDNLSSNVSNLQNEVRNGQ